MKKFLPFVLALLFSCAGFSQTMYWSVYHFEVKPGFENEIGAAFDRFFESEAGKALPYAAFGVNMFSNSKDNWTHEMLFATPDKAQFGKMYSGMLQQTAEYAVMSQSMDRASKPVASYLGKSLIGEPIPGNNYSTVYELAVSDPATYSAAFSEMRTAVMAKTGGKMGLDLHQFISGNEEGATHVAVATAPSFAELLDYTDVVFGSEEFAAFAKKVKDIRQVLRVFTTLTVKEYNVPGM
ncbi:MAG: hypothetical protein OEQ53_09775 [Saprospiraceae bacterium]|nr:hypothetical protein [Saprospiraceae bacterium]